MTRSAVDPRRADPRILTLCAVAAPLCVWAAGPAAAQAPDAAPSGKAAAETSVPRFSFAPVEGGALKLDRETGRVSLCARGPSAFTCEVVPDARDAYESEIARLKAELDALRSGMAQARPPAQAPAQTQPPAAPGATPDTSDLDRAMAYAERFYRRLKGLIDELRAPAGQERL